MAYDSFISYAHLDEEMPISWVTQFHENLTKRISVLCGSRRDIWRDQRDLEPGPLPANIQEAVASSKFLLAIMSPAYVNSNWCKEERDVFLQKLAEAGVEGDVFDRLIAAEKLPVSEDSIPFDFQDQLIVRFYEESENGSMMELQSDSHAYRLNIESIARKISKVIMEAAAAVPATERTVRLTRLGVSNGAAYQQIRLALLGSRVNIRSFSFQNESSVSPNDYVIYVVDNNEMVKFPKLGEQFAESVKKNPEVNFIFWSVPGQDGLENFRTQLYGKLANEENSNFDLIEKSLEDFKLNLKEIIS